MNISFVNKKIITFDLDGTVVRLSADWDTLRDILIERYKEHYNDDCNIERISTCLNKVVQKQDEAILNNFFDLIREFELKNIKDTQLIEETIFFINNKELFSVKKEAKFAIFSLNTRNTIKRALELANIVNKIEYIVGREDVRKWKPSPKGLLKIQKHFKIKKEEMIYFGDLEHDILTGKNAGIESYYIDDLIELVNKTKSKIKQK